LRTEGASLRKAHKRSQGAILVERGALEEKYALRKEGRENLYLGFIHQVGKERNQVK
jgi:hypothetical protein